MFQGRALELVGLVAEPDTGLGHGGEFGRLQRGGPPADRDLVPVSAPHQLVGRHSEGLADDVEHRHGDGAPHRRQVEAQRIDPEPLLDILQPVAAAPFAMP